MADFVYYPVTGNGLSAATAFTWQPQPQNFNTGSFWALVQSFDTLTIGQTPVTGTVPGGGANVGLVAGAIDPNAFALYHPDPAHGDPFIASNVYPVDVLLNSGSVALGNLMLAGFNQYANILGGNAPVQFPTLDVESATLNVTGDIIDTGTVTFPPIAIPFDGTISSAMATGGGTIDLGAGATVDVGTANTGGVVPSDITFHFNDGSGNVLEINQASKANPTGFGGTITGFVPGDTLLLPQIQNVVNGITTTANYNATTGVLAIVVGEPVTIDINLPGFSNTSGPVNLAPSGNGIALTASTGQSTAVTIPGANGPVSNSYALPDNMTVALQIQAALNALRAQGKLVSGVQGQTLPPVPAGSIGSLDIPASAAGAISAPSGYGLAADSTGGANLTLAGFSSLFGGDGNIRFTNAASSTTGLITAGNGADAFNLVAGSTYSVAAGNGNDTYSAGGTGTVSSGLGANLIFVSSTGGGNYISTHGTDTVVGQGGPATIVGGVGTQEVFGGSSNMLVVLGGNGTDTYIGGTGADTVFGGASTQVFGGTAGLTFLNSSNDSATVYGGAGQPTLWGGNLAFSGNSSITYINTTTTGAVLLGGGGNETLSAASSTSDNAFFAGQISVGGSPNDSMIGGFGNDVEWAGTGNSTMTGGDGTNVFAFLQGHAGGTDLVTDFTPEDILWLQGYDTASVQTSFNQATTGPSGLTLTLSDNTHITFSNITDTRLINNGVNIHVV